MKKLVLVLLLLLLLFGCASKNFNSDRSHTWGEIMDELNNRDESG